MRTRTCRGEPLLCRLNLNLPAQVHCTFYLDSECRFAAFIDFECIFSKFQADVSIPVYLPLGDSLLDSSRHEDVSLQYDSDELEIVMNSFMCASTPKKYTSIPFEANYVARSLFSTGSNDSMDDKEVSFTDSSDTDMDAEYLGEIYATQKPVRSSNFLLCKFNISFTDTYIFRVPIYPLPRFSPSKFVLYPPKLKMVPVYPHFQVLN